MAAFDLEQQEQIDQFKQLWNKYGNAVISIITVALLAYAGWTWYLWWQRDAADKASHLYEELDRSVIQGDAKKAPVIFADMKDKFPSATYTAHAALLLAQFQAAQGKDADAKGTLTWLTEQAKQEDLVAVGRLRLAGLLLDEKQYAAALAQVDHEMPQEFEALASDRKGDILSAQGKKAEAVAAYQKAYASFDKSLEYRRFVEGKLTVLGAAPTPAAVPSTAPAVSASAAS